MTQKFKQLLFWAFLLSGLLGLVSCSKFKSYDGPQVTRILVYKQARMLYLLHGENVLESHRINLGFAPEGDKERKGDGKTPEGAYVINRKNPDSKYHLSLGIDYPNRNDRLSAQQAEQDPGSDIFIHGAPTSWLDRGRADWTAGCIAVTNKEIENIYAMVQVGTPIDIFP